MLGRPLPGDGAPVKAHQLSHGRTGANLGQPLVVLYSQHRPPPAVGLDSLDGPRLVGAVPSVNETDSRANCRRTRSVP